MALIRTPSGRRYSTHRPSTSAPAATPTPDDPRPTWPDSARVFTETELPGGTILREWLDAPLTDAAAVELPSTLEADDFQTWRRDKPALPKAERWGAGPLPWRD